MTCKPCRVTVDGQRYFIAKDGQVYPTWRNVATVAGGVDTWSLGEALDPEVTQRVRREAQRQRRNRNARERHEALTGLGLGLTRVRGNLGGVYYE